MQRMIDWSSRVGARPPRGPHLGLALSVCSIQVEYAADYRWSVGCVGDEVVMARRRSALSVTTLHQVSSRAEDRDTRGHPCTFQVPNPSRPAASLIDPVYGTKSLRELVNFSLSSFQPEINVVLFPLTYLFRDTVNQLSL